MLPLARASAANGEVSLSNWHRVTAGCLSGAAAALAVYPMETLRTNMTMGNRAAGLGYLGLAREIVRRARRRLARHELLFKSTLANSLGQKQVTAQLLCDAIPHSVYECQEYLGCSTRGALHVASRGRHMSA